MDLVEIKKDVRSQTAKRVAQAVAATGDPALLPAKTPPVKRAVKKVVPAATSGPGPAPVKRATRTRAPAAKKAAAPPAAPELSTSEKQARYWASRNRADINDRAAGDALRAQAQSARAGMARNQAAADRKAEFTEGMKRAEAAAEAARRKKLQRTTAQVAGGTAAAGAVAGGVVAARHARKLRHLPAPGLNNAQKAVIGAGTGAGVGMLLHERSTRR